MCTVRNEMEAVIKEIQRILNPYRDPDEDKVYMRRTLVDHGNRIIAQHLSRCQDCRKEMGK